MKSKIVINPGPFLIAILSFIVFYSTASGSIQNYIHFAGVENEMAFAFVALLGTILGAFISFERVKINK